MGSRLTGLSGLLLCLPNSHLHDDFCSSILFPALLHSALPNIISYFIPGSSTIFFDNSPIVFGLMSEALSTLYGTINMDLKTCCNVFTFFPTVQQSQLSVCIFCMYEANNQHSKLVIALKGGLFFPSNIFVVTTFKSCHEFGINYSLDFPQSHNQTIPVPSSWICW